MATEAHVVTRIQSIASIAPAQMHEASLPSSAVFSVRLNTVAGEVIDLALRVDLARELHNSLGSALAKHAQR